MTNGCVKGTSGELFFSLQEWVKDCKEKARKFTIQWMLCDVPSYEQVRHWPLARCIPSTDLPTKTLEGRLREECHPPSKARRFEEGRARPGALSTLPPAQDRVSARSKQCK